MDVYYTHAHDVCLCLYALNMDTCVCVCVCLFIYIYIYIHTHTDTDLCTHNMEYCYFAHVMKDAFRRCYKHISQRTAEP